MLVLPPPVKRSAGRRDLLKTESEETRRKLLTKHSLGSRKLRPNALNTAAGENEGDVANTNKTDTSDKKPSGP